MALRPGRRDKAAAKGPGSSERARVAGFVCLSGTAVALLAVAVLLGPYARLALLRYRLERLAVECDNAAAQIDLNDRLIRAADQDEVLTRRLAVSRLGLHPVDEVTLVDRDEPRRPPPHVVAAPRRQPPPAPEAWLVRGGKKLADPTTRRGLMLLAGLAMLAAFLLFSPRSARSARPPHRR